MKIRVECYAPLHCTAVTDNYEPGDPIGFGRTEAEALQNLKYDLEEIDRRNAKGLKALWYDVKDFFTRPLL